MKKTILLLIPMLTLLFMASCKQKEIIAYEYKSTTMLGTRTTEITKDSVVTVYNGRMKNTRTARATTAEEWNQLKAASEEVKLDEIADLPSPTNRRQTDASPYGMLTISTKDSAYQSAGFDGFNAHEQLTPVMLIIQKMVETPRP